MTSFGNLNTTEPDQVVGIPTSAKEINTKDITFTDGHLMPSDEAAGVEPRPNCSWSIYVVSRGMRLADVAVA